MMTADEFVISRPPVQVWSPAPFGINHLQRSVGTLISRVVGTSALILLSATPAAADLRIPASVFVIAQATDVHSTALALSRGHREGNPLMNVGTGPQIAIKAGVTVATVVVAKRIARRHPRIATVALYGVSAFTLAVAHRNYRIARNSGGMAVYHSDAPRSLGQ